MNVIKRNIPNAVTCLNMAAGVMAILCAAKGSAPLWGLDGIQWAWIFIGIAAVADFLDGFCARLLHAYSELGKQLDSLCDAVSFGVAPGVMMHYALLDAGAPGWTSWCVILIPILGVLRLAKFNIDTRQSVNFIGLPIPANAIFWIGYASLLAQGVGFLATWYWFILILLVETWLMVSPVHFFSLKFKNWGWKENQWRWLMIITTAVLVFCMGVGGLLWTIVVYACYSILDSNDRRK